MSEPLVRTESLGGSPLSRAGRAGELPEWFVPVPRSADAWKAHAKTVMAGAPSRWLDDLAPAIAASGPAAERLKKSTNGKGLVITTGQQPGLFGGPLMTFAKALSALAIADVLQETLGIPVSPLFWAATDDADFDEAARVSVSLDGGARELVMAQTAPAGTPMARVPIGDDIERLVPLLRDACGTAPHASYLERAVALYREGATVGDAYVALLRSVLEPLGIPVLDASHPSFASAAAPVLLRAAHAAPAIAAAVKRRDEAIVARGLKPQVDDVPNLSLVSLNANGVKRRLTQAEAVAFQAASGAWLSSTVLLRPVLERALLPTAAYVGGPGEIAYFGQLTAVADALGVERPLVVPRWSTTIVEPRIQKILSTVNVAVEDLTDPHAVETRLAREALSPAVDSALRALRADLVRDVQQVGRVNDGLVPNDVIEGVRRSIEHRLERLERRVVAGAKRRETDLMTRIATARGAFFPHGVRQERTLAWVPFVARYGEPLIERMIDEARAHARLIVDAPALAPAQSPAAVR